MPTILEVAQKAGVSPTTVSHVINNTRFVSASVRARVVAAMDELGYRPNALARSLRRGETHTLGLVLPDSANSYFAEVGNLIESAAFQQGYSVILCNTEDDPVKELMYSEVLANKQVDGIIFVSTGEKTEAVQKMSLQGLPLVLVDRELPGIEADAVLVDNLTGGRMATHCLVQAGHRRIACITGPSHVTPSTQRVTGFRQAMAEAGLYVTEEWIVRGNFHPEAGYQAAARLLRLAERPTAIFACNDLMAIGVLRAAGELGLRIPDELALVGFDDINLAAYTLPSLTTISQPKAEIGQTAIQFMMERIAERRRPARCTILPPQLIVRQSCPGPCPTVQG